MNKTIKNLRKQGVSSPATPSKRSGSVNSNDSSPTSSQLSGNGNPKAAKSPKTPAPADKVVMEPNKIIGEGTGSGQPPELPKVVDDVIVDPIVPNNLNMTNNDEVINDNTLKTILHRMEEIDRRRGLTPNQSRTMYGAQLYGRIHAPVIPSPSGFSEARTPSVQAQFSPAYVSVHGNPNYLASEKIGYPKDPMQRNVEVLVGLGFYKDVERDPQI
jgi:hypothetical protein